MVGLMVQGTRQAEAAIPIVDVAVTAFPSLNETALFLLKGGGFDIENGVNIRVIPRPLRALFADYRSGRFKVYVGGSPVNESLHRAQGLKSQILFFHFEYFGALLTERDDIKTLKDLEGKNLAANTPSANYAVFEWFAKKEGVDVKKLKAQSLGTGGLVPALMAKRADAVQLWEPMFSEALEQAPGRFRPILYHQKWKDHTGFTVNPYLCMAAHEDWTAQNKEVIPKLYAAYKAASDFMESKPGEAIEIIHKVAGEDRLSKKVLTRTVKEDTFKFKVGRVDQLEKETRAVIQSMVDIGRTKVMPGPEIFYRW
jgi:hypothetical protein